LPDKKIWHRGFLNPPNHYLLLVDTWKVLQLCTNNCMTSYMEIMSKLQFGILLFFLKFCSSNICQTLTSPVNKFVINTELGRVRTQCTLQMIIFHELCSSLIYNVVLFCFYPYNYSTKFLRIPIRRFLVVLDCSRSFFICSWPF